MFWYATSFRRSLPSSSCILCMTILICPFYLWFFLFYRSIVFSCGLLLCRSYIGESRTSSDYSFTLLHFFGRTFSSFCLFTLRFWSLCPQCCLSVGCIAYSGVLLFLWHSFHDISADFFCLWGFFAAFTAGYVICSFPDFISTCFSHYLICWTMILFDVAGKTRRPCIDLTPLNRSSSTSCVVVVFFVCFSYGV